MKDEDALDVRRVEIRIPAPSLILFSRFPVVPAEIRMAVAPDHTIDNR